MFWNMETYELDTTPKPEYRVLETVYERIYKKTWLKLDTNAPMTNLIVKSVGEHENWDIVKENNGKKYLWVTDKFLTLLHLKGVYERHD